VSYKNSLSVILKHIERHHPELVGELDANEADFLKNGLSFRAVASYRKDYKCELATLCDKYGSDKGEIRSSGHPYPWPSHSYSDYYRRIWGHCRMAVKRVFECGLGTNNPHLASSMGASGKPGASLRVWRDYFPNAQIYGADIDRDILFSEDRIKTFYIDQLNPSAIRKCWTEVGESSFDFIIDDGLHRFEAGSCLFSNSVEMLSENGIYVIEDVTSEDVGRYVQFFNNGNFLVDYISMYRPNISLGDNNLVVIRKM